MEKHEILSMKNCHRAATVQQIANPEYGVWKFEWRGQKLGGNAFYTEYAHIASKPCFGNATVISDNDNDMKFWEVLTWKYETNMAELWEAARRAFSATSFDPEKRAAQYIREYEKLLLDERNPTGRAGAIYCQIQRVGSNPFRQTFPDNECGNYRPGEVPHREEPQSQ